MAKKRKVYTPEFKLEAIRLLESSMLTVGAVARDLDVDPGRLQAWRREFNESGKPPAAIIRVFWKSIILFRGPKAAIMT